MTRRGAALGTLRLVVAHDAKTQDPRELAVRGVRRSLGRLLRALPAAGWNASAFPDAVVTQLAQYDSVTAAYLWGSERLDAMAVDEAVSGMMGIEGWVRGALSSTATAAVRCRELQVKILDEELKDPLVLSEWTDAFIQARSAEACSEDTDDVSLALAGLSAHRLGVIARRLGVASPADWSCEGQDGRSRLHEEIVRTLRDPALLCVLVSTLPDPARGLLAQLVGGCCDDGCLQRWAELYIAEPVCSARSDEEPASVLGHPVQLLRDCGLVFLDPACRLAVPQGLVAPLRVVLGTLRKLGARA